MQPVAQDIHLADVRGILKGSLRVEMALTGEDNPNTVNLARHTGAKIYKRYRLYKKKHQ